MPESGPPILASQIVTLLSSTRFHFASEAELQRQIAEVFADNKFPCHREFNLTAADRVDFFIEPGLAIEVKIGGSATMIIRQLHRYAQCEQVKELILVTSSLRHIIGLPLALNGKKVTGCYLQGSSF